MTTFSAAPASVRRLLDREQAARLLAALPGQGSLHDVEIESVWAKPGRHFNVCYRLGEPRGGQLASLCLVNASEAARARRRIDRGGELASAFAMASEDVLAQRFPFDYRLENLPSCLDPEVARRATGDRSVDGWEVAAYRAGMRCQIRYTAAGTARLYGKIAFDRERGRRRRVHRQVLEATAAAPVRLPAVEATIDDWDMDLVRAVDGSSLHDRLAEGPDLHAVEASVAALAWLHRNVPAIADRVHSAEDELALLDSWTQWMSVVAPEIAAPFLRVHRLLAEHVPSSVPTSFAHRDFHDKQVLFGSSHLWLLDIDTACAGDPELDLGNFLAHLYLRGVQWERLPEHRGLAGAAEAAYGAGARPDVTRWYRRASLARLACVYWLRPRWREVVPALLAEALGS